MTSRKIKVQMMTGVGGAEPMLRRVKQEVDPPAQYSPPEAQPPLVQPLHPRQIPMMQSPELELEPKEEVKFCLSPGEGSIVGNASPEQQHCSSTTVAAASGARDDEAPRRFCLVCGDTASGFHYGVASCEACKAFFKRTIQGNIDYTCPASNECEINKRRRKACQACRFRKCLRMGMLREGVRLDRVRGGRQKYRRAPDQPAHHQRPMLDDIKVLEVLLSYEPELLSSAAAVAAPAQADAGARTLALLADLYDRELVAVIGWAKQIPGFTELHLNEQMRLLKSTWAEMLSLMVAYRSMSGAANGGANSANGSGGSLRLRFGSDLTLDEQQARDIGAQDLYTQLSGVTRRLERLGALREECVLLKALVLANSEPRLDEHAALRRFHDSILAALNDAVSALRPYNANAALQQLLLVLPAIRHADVAVRRFWYGVHRDRRVHVNKLFLEMLESGLR